MDCPVPLSKSCADFSFALQAPEELRPTNRFGSPEAALKHFEGRDKTIAYLRKADGLRDHAIDSPFGKKLDGYQWLLSWASEIEAGKKARTAPVTANSNWPNHGWQ